jgi:hypothetical protein
MFFVNMLLAIIILIGSFWCIIQDEITLDILSWVLMFCFVGQIIHSFYFL